MYLDDQLLSAVERQSIDEAISLINQGANPNAEYPGGFPVLYVACEDGGCAQIVKALLDAGAVPYKSVDGGATPIHLACEGGNAEIVKMLLDHRVNPNVAGPGGMTPLILATFHGYGRPDVVKVLIDAGADVNTLNHQFRTPLYAACNFGHLEVAQMLIDAGASVNHSSSNDGIYIYSPMYFALQGAVKHDDPRYWDIVKLLIKNGFNPILSSTDPGSALFAKKLLPKAVKERDDEISKTLEHLASMERELLKDGGVIVERDIPIGVIEP